MTSNLLRLITIMISLLLSTLVQAKTVAVEVSASGMTKEIAIEQALIRAVSQVKGVDVNSRSARQTAQVKVNGKNSSVIAIENATLMLTKGQVTSYDVISESCDERNCEVALKVNIPVYKSPGLSPNKRRKLAVIPFSGEYGREFSKNLQTLLVQSRRFAILDREEEHLYQQEKKLLLDSNTAISEKMRLGQVLGLDYIVIGDVKAKVNVSVDNIQLTGEQESSIEYNNTINYKVINLTTRQIKWQDQLIIDDDIRELSSAGKVSSTITFAIYPMKVIKKSDQQLVLNQGGKSVAVGTVFDVFSLGEKLIDPYTKESLGREETFVGKVQVERVTTKVSYAAFVSGDYRKMTKHSIVRVSPTMNDEYKYQEPIQRAKSTIETSSAGGIILPMAKKEKLKTSPQGGVIINN